MSKLPPHEYRARVRKNPFLRMSEHAVRERGYFLWLTDPNASADAHWLEAEAVETDLAASAQLVRLYDRQHVELAERQFDEWYRPVRHWFFAPDTSGHAKVEVGRRGERTCSICLRGRTSVPPATFEKVAHLVPEALGNRWLTTADECDACNERFGSDYEDDLGKMTLAARAMTGTRAKKGTAKLKPRRKSALGGGPRGGPVQIELHPDDPSVASRLEDDNSLAIEADLQPFRPGRAAKALARVAWQALPLERRLAHEPLRRWLLDPAVGPSVLYSAWVPELHGLTLGVWEQDEVADLPPLVLAVGLAGTVLVWAAPDWRTGFHSPAVLPLLPRSSRGYIPNVTKFSATADEKVAGRARFDLGFERAVLVQSRDPIAVRVARNDDPTVTIDAYLVTKSLPSDLQEKGALYEIADGELIGVLHIALPFRAPAVGKFVFEARSSPAANIDKTTALVAAINAGCGITVRTVSDDRLIATTEGADGGVPPDEIAPRVRIGAWLAEINRALNVSIAYPAVVDEREGWTIEVVAAGIRNGVVAERPRSGAIQMILDAGGVADLLAALASNSPALEAMNTMPYEFKGVRLEVGPVRIVIEGPKLIEDEAALLARVGRWPDDHREAVSLACDRILYEFLDFAHAVDD